MNLEDILRTREEKWKTALSLTSRKEGKSAISVSLNSPGETKRRAESLRALGLVMEDILLRYESEHIAFDELIFKKEGAYPYFIFNARGDPIKLKKIATEIEEKHPIGRLLDVDIIKPDGSKVSRKDLGLPERVCFLCNLPWIECRRSGRHSAKEIESFYEKAIKKFLKERMKT